MTLTLNSVSLKLCRRMNANLRKCQYHLNTLIVLKSLCSECSCSCQPRRVAYGKKMKKLVAFSCLFSIYIVLGALIFRAFETENEIKENTLIKSLRERFNRKYNITDDDWGILESIMKEKQSLNTNPLVWSFGNAFIFAGSVVTTVGRFKFNFLTYILLWLW